MISYSTPKAAPIILNTGVIDNFVTGVERITAIIDEIKPIIINLIECHATMDEVLKPIALRVAISPCSLAINERSIRMVTSAMIIVTSASVRYFTASIAPATPVVASTCSPAVVTSSSPYISSIFSIL